ncbi:MAG: Fur family transcriptional regulator [Pseudomonadota bacterium]
MSKTEIEKHLERICSERGMRMTEQRRIIANIISKADDHPDVEEIYNRALVFDKKISVSTVYRTVRLLEEAGVLAKHDFGDGRARYEEIGEDHHDHLICVKSGKVIEFFNQELEDLKEKIAAEYGYKLVDHRLELYAVPSDDAAERS